MSGNFGNLIGGLGKSMSPFLTATGGSITTDGDFKVHSFTSSGTFAFYHSSGIPLIQYLVVAGGGGSAGRWFSNCYWTFCK